MRHYCKEECLRWISKLTAFPEKYATEIDDLTQLNSARIKQLERENVLLNYY